jgi:hypothetical protein
VKFRRMGRAPRASSTEPELTLETSRASRARPSVTALNALAPTRRARRLYVAGESDPGARPYASLGRRRADLALCCPRLSIENGPRSREAAPRDCFEGAARTRGSAAWRAGMGLGLRDGAGRSGGPLWARARDDETPVLPCRPARCAFQPRVGWRARTPARRPTARAIGGDAVVPAPRSWRPRGGQAPARVRHSPRGDEPTGAGRGHRHANRRPRRTRAPRRPW